MDANNPIATLVEFVSLQQTLWEQLRDACGGSVALLLLDVPKSGVVKCEGREWSFKKHGQGVLFTEKRGKRRVDLHDVAAGSDRIDSWRIATYFGGLGREGEKFINRVVGSPEGTMEERVQRWLDRLVADGALVLDGSKYRLAESSW